MLRTPALADLLREFIQRSPYLLTPGLLGKLTGLPKSTIINWLEGRVARPRHWEDLVRVADALRLDEADTNLLLRSAGHPPIAELRTSAHAAEQVLFRLWPQVTTPAPLARLATLPTPATALLGRERALAELKLLLLTPAIRLVTLTGVGGAGKTRLGLQALIELQDAFPGGAVFVALAALIDARLVLPTIAQMLGVMPMPGVSTSEQLQDELRERSTILLLDNFEHLLPAAGEIAALLASAPRLTLLVTSRVRLHIDGEHMFSLPALPTPTPHADLQALLANPSVALFVQRANAADPSFRLDPGNARSIAAICERLEGLPLSIELAAARVKLLTPTGLLARLGNRLNLLRWGSHSLLQRHRTLRETLNWSYDLLSPAAQLLFRRLAVFMGGCTVAAIESIAALAPQADADMIDVLMLLTDSSLLQIEPGQDEPRYQMLETLREYAAERLIASGEADTLYQRHANYYLQLAEQAEPQLNGPDQLRWLARLDRERDNLRSALTNALGQGQPILAGRLAASLREYWILRGQLEEGRRWLSMALERSEQIDAATLAKVLLVAGRLARQQNDLGAAETQAEQSLARYRNLGDQHGIAEALNVLGVVAYDQGDFARARRFHEESLDIRRSLGNQSGAAGSLTNLGEVTRQQGDLAAARTLQEQSLAIFRTLDDTAGVAISQTNLGLLLLEIGQLSEAAAQLEEALALWHHLDERIDSAECIEGLAVIAALRGDDTRAATLWGAVDGLHSTTGTLNSPVDRTRFGHVLTQLATRMPEADFQAAHTTGYRMPLSYAVAYALRDASDRAR